VAPHPENAWRFQGRSLGFAGVYGTKGPIEKIDWEEWSRTIDINLKGTVWQCRAVLPYMKKQGHGKIIVISGGGATNPCLI